MCASTSRINSIDNYYNTKLRPKHSYSILNIIDINGLKLIQLRDPNRSNNWKDYYSDTNRIQTLLPIELKGDKSDDGIFWMRFALFIKYFGSINICKIRKNWSEYRISDAFHVNSLDTNTFSAVLITVCEPTEVDICLYQSGYRKALKEYKLNLKLCLAVFPKDGIIGNHVKNTKYFRNGNTYCNETLKPGNYLITCMAFKHWNNSKFNNENKIFISRFNYRLHILNKN